MLTCHFGFIGNGGAHVFGHKLWVFGLNLVNR